MVNPTPWSSFKRLKWLAAALALAGAAIAAPAFAAQPVDWQIWHQPAATPNMQAIESFDWLTLYVIVPITLLVMGLLGWVIFRFNAKSNPTPEKTTHNTAIEVIWTLGPVAILVFLAIPSFQLLSSQFNPPEPPSLTIKATGYQWYWGYEYQDSDQPIVDGTETAEEPAPEPEVLTFESRPIGVLQIAGSEAAALKEREDLNKTDLAEYPRLLAVDNELVVPVGRVVRVLVTAGDVIHNFAMPAFGLKMDGYPGRLNETFFQATREGLYYGQCSELCGKFHAYMPIGIRVVSQTQYDSWREAAGNDLQAANVSLKAEIAAAKAADNKIDVASDGSKPAAAATN